MGASALIFSVMMPCKGHKKRVPNFGNEEKRRKWAFPKLGTAKNHKNKRSQCWEQPKIAKTGLPKVGNSIFLLRGAFLFNNQLNF